MKSKFILAIFTGVLFYGKLSAQSTVISNGMGGGDWSLGTTWVGGVPPVAGDNVIIDPLDVVNADAGATPITCNWIEIYGTLIIDNGVTLTVNGCDGGNAFGENFTIDGATPGIFTNNGSLVLDQGACGGGPLYSNQLGGTFTNNGTVTIDNGGNLSMLSTTVNAGTIDVNGSSYFQIFSNTNNTGGVINVNSSSTLLNGGGGSFLAGNGTININAGGIYDHAQNSGTVPTCTWDITSSCNVTGITTTPPAGLGQVFGDFKWDCRLSVANLNLAGTLTTINGNFTLSETGNPAKTVQFATITSPVINIGGDMIIAANQTDAIQFSTTGSPTINVAGNVILSAGKIIMGTSGNPVFNVTGNYTHSATVAGNTFQMSGGAGTGTLNLTGNFSYTSSTSSLITETSSGKGIINFVRGVGGTQTFNTAVASPFANTIELYADASSVGNTLDMSASTSNLTFTGSSQLFTVNGTLVTGTRIITCPASTAFTLSSGATLNTNNVSGVSGAAAGTIQGAGTKTFNNAANYILGGASTTTGFTNNTIMNNLTTNATTALGQAINVNGNFVHSAGTFTSVGNTMNVTGTFTNSGTFTAGASVLNITGLFTNSGTGVFNANTSTLNLTGDFSNSGTFTANTGSVVFNGSAAQSIGGASTTTFYNITSNNTCVACGVSLAQDANLSGTLTINSRTFTTTGFNFRLLSDASGTASIGPITAAGADFVGNIIMERYTGSSLRDWRLLCSAVSGSTIADWADDFATSGFTGSTDPSNPFVSIQYYDELTSGDLDQGFTPAGNVTDPIVDGRGYFVFLGPNPLTFSVTGPPNKFDNPLAVSYFDNYSSVDDGWNLVSNPYPSAIDWDAVSWTKTSMDDAIYIYNSYTGTYAYHCPVDSTPIDGNGGTRYIASQQAFWVKANTDLPAPDLTAHETVKASSPNENPVFLKPAYSPNTSNYPSAFKDFPVPLNTNNTPGRIKLTASGGGIDDEIFLHFKQGATNNFDGKFDAWKLRNDPLVRHNFSSVMNGVGDLAVNGMSPLVSDVSIPLRLTVPATGTYKISRDSILMLPLSSCLILEDKKTGSMIDLRTNVSYSFTISDTTKAPRFILHIYAPLTKKAINNSCSSSNNGKAIAKGIGTGPWNYVWKNSAGTILKTTTGSAAADTLLNCAPGTYSVTVNSAVCGSVTDTIVIKAPAILAGAVSQTGISCFGGNTGSAAVSSSGGTPGYTYLWNSGKTTSAVSNLYAGNYSVTVTDLNGCIFTASVTIGQPTALTHSVSQTNVACFGGNNGSAMISSSGGASGYSYLWNNGNTTSAISGLYSGNYSVTVTDVNGCTSTASITLGQPTAITYSVVQTNVACFGGNNGSAVVSSSGGTPGYSYLWNNGQSTPLVSGLSSGNYVVTVTDTQGCTTTASVSITQPSLLVNTVSHTNVSCFGSNDGSASVLATGGSPAYSFSWNNGKTTSSISGLSIGNYSVTTTDSNGCISSATVAVTQPGLLTAGYTASSHTVDIALGSNVTFTNTSLGASTYEWNFGDASATDVSLNPVHAYSMTGTYSVTLISSHGACSDSAHGTIAVTNSNPTGISENQSASGIHVAYDHGQVFLVFALNQETQVNISVFNMLGEEIFAQHDLQVKQQRVKLDFPAISGGIYIAVSEMKDAVVSKKIIIPAR